MNPTNDIFQGLSILLLGEDDARGKALAKALRDQRARVGEMGGVSAREGSRGVDLAIVDARSERACAAQLAALRADVRGRWASVLTIDYEQFVKGDGSVALAGLIERVAPLVEADGALLARARDETTFKTKLSLLGPPRTLRALSLSGHTLFVELRTNTLDALIEVSNELLVSASATRGEKRWEAWSALVRILGLSECEITVSRRSFTSFMNIMEPVDQALEVAAQERQCSAEQIAAEEADAEARGTGSYKLPPRAPAAPGTQAAAATPWLPGHAPPRPAARPAGSLGHQRTLMGVIPGLPALGIAANDVRALAAKPPPEAPRYAHRHTDARPPPTPGIGGGAKAASMTLMGVAPSAIPGLAQLRAQRAAEKVAEPIGDSRTAQREALQSALKEDDFDPPTVRHNLVNLAELSAELPDLADDLSLSARSLSSPLPPPDSERDDSEREPPTQPGLSFDDYDDSQERTIVASSALTEELLAQALEGAATERPPAQVATALASMANEPAATRKEDSEAIGSLLAHELEELPQSEPPTAQERPDTNSEPAPASDPQNDPAAGEETLVVHMKPKKPTGRLGKIGALLLLAGLLGLLLRAGMRPPAAEPAPPQAVSALKPAAKGPASPAASAPAKNPEPVAPSPALGPAAEVPAAEPPAAKAPIEEAPAAKAAIEEVPPAIDAVDAPVELDEPASAGPATDEATEAAATTALNEVDELLKKGQRLLVQRDAAAARPVLEQALALSADNPHVRASLGEALLKLNELPLALVQAQTAVKLRPKRGRYLVLQGDVLAAMGKPDEAREAFRRAFNLDPNDAEAKRKAGF